MTKRRKLFEAIRNNPKDVRFDDLVKLLESVGFVRDRQGGSHLIYGHSNPRIPIVNVQEGKAGKAKPYQVAQVLALIEQYKLEA